MDEKQIRKDFNLMFLLGAVFGIGLCGFAAAIIKLFI